MSMARREREILIMKHLCKGCPDDADVDDGEDDSGR